MIPIGQELPQAIRQLVPWLALGHGILHGALLLLFYHQGWLGHLIRRARRAGTSPPPAELRRHRRNGPRLAFLCLLGYAAGPFIVLLDWGRIGVYPLHLFLGTAIILAVGGAYFLSRRIKAGDSAWRDWHRRLGITILLLYPLQVLLGLAVLL